MEREAFLARVREAAQAGQLYRVHTETTERTAGRGNIGGDLIHLGAESIVVKITNPTDDSENAEPLQKVRISNEAMATSGGYRRGFMHDGNWISHIFNVQTMEPTEAHASVSVIAPTAIQADALATVCGVLPPGDALLFANKMNDIGVLIVSAQGEIASNNVWDRHIID